MADTFYEVPTAKYARVVTTNNKDAAGKITETANPAKLPVSLRGDGGLFSTAPDYGKFLQMLLNGGQLGNARILKASTVADMLKPHTNGVRVRPQPVANTGLSKPYPLGAGEDIWGLGFQLADPKKADPSMRRPGSGNWAGIFNTFFWIDPKEELGVIVMMQMLPFYDDGGDRDAAGRGAARLLEPASDKGSGLTVGQPLGRSAPSLVQVGRPVGLQTSIRDSAYCGKARVQAGRARCLLVALAAPLARSRRPIRHSRPWSPSPNTRPAAVPESSSTPRT